MIEQLQYQLKSVRLSGMAENLNIRLQEAKANDLTYEGFLQNLLDAELNRRRDRLLNRRMKQAHFPFLKTMEDFDFRFNLSIEKRKIKELETTAFVTRAENVLFLGPPGVGKTHLAVAVGTQAIQNGFAVFYRSIFDMVTDFAVEPPESMLPKYLKPHLLILDELGMKTLTPIAAESLLEIIHRRYHSGSTIIATNRPIEDWGSILGDNVAVSAVLDRFLENIHFIKITGKSYRLKNLNMISKEKEVEEMKKSD